MRLFVSIDLPESFTEEIEELQAEFSEADGLTFTDPDQVHVTLKFLGDVPEERLDALVDALGTAVVESGVEPFDATFGGLGVFPDLDYISVVWFGVREGGDEMTRLHEAIEERVVDLGFDPEDHDFTPHATLARMKHTGGKELVQEKIQTLSPDIGSVRVEDIRLTKSDLTSEGSEYSTVKRFPL